MQPNASLQSVYCINKSFYDGKIMVSFQVALVTGFPMRESVFFPSATVRFEIDILVLIKLRKKRNVHTHITISDVLNRA